MLKERKLIHHYSWRHDQHICKYEPKRNFTITTTKEKREAILQKSSCFNDSRHWVAKYNRRKLFQNVTWLYAKQCFVMGLFSNMSRQVIFWFASLIHVKSSRISNVAVINDFSPFGVLLERVIQIGLLFISTPACTQRDIPAFTTRWNDFTLGKILFKNPSRESNW